MVATESQEETQERVDANDPSFNAQPQEVNSGGGEADQARGGGLEPSSSSSSGSDKEDIDGDSDAARESPPRGDPQWRPRRRAILAGNNLLLSPDASSDDEVGSRVSPSRGTVRHRPADHDSRGPSPQRARLDGENKPRRHISGNGQEGDDVRDALFASSVGYQRGSEALAEVDGMADFNGAPSELDCGGYSFDGGFDGVATPPPEGGVEEREDKAQGMRGGEVSHDVGLGGGVEEAKGEGCAEDPGNVVGTRGGTVDDCQWCRQDRCPYFDGVGGDGSGGDLVSAGAGASAAGVHRLERGRTYAQGPVQDTQTHDSVTRPAETGSDSAAGSNSVRVPRVSLEPQVRVADVKEAAKSTRPQQQRLRPPPKQTRSQRWAIRWPYDGRLNLGVVRD